MKSLAIFHGTWWVWLKRQEKISRDQQDGSKETIMKLEDVETAFMELRKLPLSMAKMFFGPIIKGYVRLMETTKHTEVTAKLKECISNGKVYAKADVLLNPSTIRSKIKTMTHGDAWINNMMFTSSDPQVN